MFGRRLLALESFPAPMSFFVDPVCEPETSFFEHLFSFALSLPEGVVSSVFGLCSVESFWCLLPAHGGEQTPAGHQIMERAF